MSDGDLADKRARVGRPGSRIVQPLRAGERGEVGRRLRGASCGNCPPQRRSREDEDEHDGDDP